MQSESERLFDAVNRIKRLHIGQHMGLLPGSELVILKTVRDIQQSSGHAPGVSEVAQQLAVSPPAISRKLKTLREKQLIDTIVDETDRRNVCLRVTEQGSLAVKKSMEEVGAFWERVLRRLTPDETAQFYQLLQKIYDGIQQELTMLEPYQNRKEKGDACSK